MSWEDGGLITGRDMVIQPECGPWLSHFRCLLVQLHPLEGPGHLIYIIYSILSRRRKKKKKKEEEEDEEEEKEEEEDEEEDEEDEEE